ncbi:MAG: hypothetical protein HOH04_03115 [Rhodospirillaceae bacterium]|nr:hypothetical protein [Rhodospirillaceae bacterium]
MIRPFGKLLILFGLATFMAALAWWLAFFHQMLGDDVKRASECFYSTTLECEVGNMVGHFMDIPPYDPVALWISGVIFGMGLLIYAWAPHR